MTILEGLHILRNPELHPENEYRDLEELGSDARYPLCAGIPDRQESVTGELQASFQEHE